MSQQNQQIPIKLIPTDKLKATVYDLSKERDQINKVITDIETEIYSRANSPKTQPPVTPKKNQTETENKSEPKENEKGKTGKKVENKKGKK